MATKVTRFSTFLSSVVSISPNNTVSSPAPRQNICTAGEATSTEQQGGCCERLLVKLCDPGMKLQTQREGVYAAVGSQMWEGHWQGEGGSQIYGCGSRWCVGGDRFTSGLQSRTKPRCPSSAEDWRYWQGDALGWSAWGAASLAIQCYNGPETDIQIPVTDLSTFWLFQ